MVSAALATDTDASVQCLSPIKQGRGEPALDSFVQSFHKGIEATPAIRRAPLSTTDLQHKGVVPSGVQVLNRSIVTPPRMPQLSVGKDSRVVALLPIHSRDYSHPPITEEPLVHQPEVTDKVVLQPNPGGEVAAVKTSSEKTQSEESVTRDRSPIQQYACETAVSKKDVTRKVNKPSTSKISSLKPSQVMNIAQPVVAVTTRGADESSLADKLQQSIVLPSGLQVHSNEAPESICVAGLQSRSLLRPSAGESKVTQALRKDDHQQSVPAESSAAAIDTPVGEDSANRPQTTVPKDSTIALTDQPNVSDAKVAAGSSVGAISSVDIRQLIATSVPGYVADRGLRASGNGAFQEQPSAGVGVRDANLSQRFDEHADPGTAHALVDGMPRMVGATTTSLEVGVHSETHGWLRVRAELTDTGAVNASIAASSPERQSILHGELPGLTAFLHEEKVAVGVTVVHTPAAIDTHRRESAALGDRESNPTSHRNDGGGQQKQHLEKTTSQAGGESTRFGGEDRNEESGMNYTSLHVSGRGWLSVRA